MVNNQETLGQLIQYLLYHMKSIEVRMDWSSHNFKGQSKHELSLAIGKVRTAIDVVCHMSKNKDLIHRIKKDLDKVDLVYYMTLTEQLFMLRAEELEEITDLIDTYLKQKALKYEQEELAGTHPASNTP